MKLVAGTLAGLALLASATPVDGSGSGYDNNNNNKVTSHVRNANHIFNSIHSSMRQWGSAWHHNGMSFFLASVPAGTHFYHGTRSEYRVNGTEWLAFEPEHALNFARMGPPGGGPGGPRGPGGGPPGGPPEAFGHFPPPDGFPPGPPPPGGFPPGPPPPGHFPPHGPPPGAPRKRGNQKVMTADDDESAYAEEQKFGYLHTYSTNKDLRLLLIDGLSAGKTNMGTMDSQDRILLGDQDLTQVNTAAADDDDRKKNHGPGGEFARAVVGCEIAKNNWNDRIDGFLRTEAGFEIILCDFARDLDVVRINAVAKEDDTFPQGFGNSGYFYLSIASRFHGIGGERVKVNYDNFVTAFTYEDLDLFDGGKNEMPRLSNFSTEELRPIRDDLTRLVMEHETVEEPAFNWQAIVDMVVTKYSNLLMFLVSDEIESLENLQQNVTNVFLSFIDGRQRDAAAETERCATQFLPSLASNLDDQTSLAGKVVYDISHTICSTLRSTLDDTYFSIARARINNLIEYLAWTTWKDCKTKCGYNQACFIPIWPFGTVEDRENPQCKDGTMSFRNGGEGYWRGGPGGGKPPRREHGGEL